MWLKKKFTLRKLSFILKVSYKRKVIIHVLMCCMYFCIYLRVRVRGSVYVWVRVFVCVWVGCVFVTDWVWLCACFDMCGTIYFVRNVIWICKDRINTQIPIVLFKHQIGITSAQVDFCTLNNVSCSSKRGHIPHKNDTRWFGIENSFIKFTIIYNS